MISIDSINLSIKVKGGNLVIKTGLVIEEPIAKIPLKLVPKINWDKEVETMIVKELIKKRELDTVLAMSGYKPKDSDKKGSAGAWSENK